MVESVERARSKSTLTAEVIEMTGFRSLTDAYVIEISDGFGSKRPLL
jgi:hypothetical protein